MLICGCDNDLSITLSDCNSDPSYLTGALAELCDDASDNDGDGISTVMTQIVSLHPNVAHVHLMT